MYLYLIFHKYVFNMGITHVMGKIQYSVNRNMSLLFYRFLLMILFFFPQQLSHIPSDCSANFDFSRKGLLVFTDGAIINGNAQRSSNNLTASGLPPWSPKLGNEDFNSIIQQMAQVKLYLVMGLFSFISPIIG